MQPSERGRRGLAGGGGGDSGLAGCLADARSCAAAVITISWNSVSRNLHVNSFYLELAEVISARLLLLRCFVTVVQQDRYFHGGGYWLLLRAPA